MRKLLIGAAVVLVLLGGGIALAPLLIPVDTVKALLTERVRATTGRELTISGDISASVFPDLAVRLNGVSLSNPDGFRSKEMARLGDLRVVLKPAALLSGRVEIDSLVLVDPVISLEVASDGRANWVFAKPSTAAPSTPAGPAETATSGASTITDLGVGDVRIVNGKFTHSDARSGAATTLDSVALKIAAPSLDKPLTARGSALWRGETVEIALDAAKPRVLLDAGGATDVTLSVASKPVKLSFVGSLDAGTMTATGALDLSAPSARGAIAWATGKPLDLPGNTLGPFSLKAETSASAKRVDLKKLALELDALRLGGEVSLNLGGATPMIKAALEGAGLDLDPYLPAESGGSVPAVSSGTAPVSNPGAKAPSAAPVVANAGWSEAPIDVSFLKSFDADVILKAGAVKARRFESGQTRLTIGVRGGKLTLDVAETPLYKGTGSGKVVVDGSRPGGVGLDASLTLKGAAAEPLLRAVAGFERLEGSVDINAKISGRGVSQSRIVSSLAGDGRVAFTNGAIKGINLAAMVRNLGGAFVGNDAAQKTDFAELSGGFTIASGVLVNKDLTMMAPLVRLGGAGTVDLPKRRVNYVVTPKAAATLEGQGGQRDVTGILVPVIVEGPWDNLSYRPDLEAMIKDNAQDKVKKLIEDAGKGAGGAIPGIGKIELPKIDPGSLFKR